MTSPSFNPILEVRDLTVHYPVRGTWAGRSARRVVHAVEQVSFTLARGETLGLVGESGCGKSTLARQIVALERPTSGSVLFDGIDLSALSPQALRALRPRFQMVFQDTGSALNPRHTVREILSAPLHFHGHIDRRDTVATEQRLSELLDMVGLPRDSLSRYPHEFSGGQRQRIGIARALSLSPELLVCDEPTGALDVSVQARILQLLQTLQKELTLSMIFIGHNLPVVREVSDRVAVMYMGQLVELMPTQALPDGACHPYTRALCRAVPVADPRVEMFTDLPALDETGNDISIPAGCRFHPRCPMATDACRRADFVPSLQMLTPSHSVACPYGDSPEDDTEVMA